MKTSKTIADLNINLTFSKSLLFHSLSEFTEKFKKANPYLVNYKIIPDTYLFEVYIPNEYNQYVTLYFNVTIHKGTDNSLSTFLYKIDSCINKEIKKSDDYYHPWTELEKFILVNKTNNSFKIEFSIPF